MNRWSPTRIVFSIEPVGTTEASPMKILTPKTINASTSRWRVERRNAPGSLLSSFASNGLKSAGSTLDSGRGECAGSTDCGSAAGAGRSQSSSDTIAGKLYSIVMSREAAHNQVNTCFGTRNAKRRNSLRHPPSNLISYGFLTLVFIIPAHYKRGELQPSKKANETRRIER